MRLVVDDGRDAFETFRSFLVTENCRDSVVETHQNDNYKYSCQCAFKAFKNKLFWKQQKSILLKTRNFNLLKSSWKEAGSCKRNTGRTQ